MTTVKPIIRLPQRGKSISMNRSPFAETNGFQQIITSEHLFFEDNENKLIDYDIHGLLKDYALLKITRERDGGYLSFPDLKIAERVYTLFNGYTFANQAVLKFRLYLNDATEPKVEGPILEVKNLPVSMDHNQLYDLFRPYGPLSVCQTIVESGAIRGGAFIQYFFNENSDTALNDLNGKLVDGNIIQINSLVMNSQYQVNKLSPTSEKDNEGFVDYMNLYVKNLDPTVDNNDLFNIFRKYGRIVSARVMTNPHTGQSKGYGFVSFSKPEEANLALNEMDGVQYRSKPMVVAYHEPKKPRQEKSTSTTTSSFHSPPPTAPIDYMAAPYFEARHPHEVGALNGLGIDNVEQINISLKDLTSNTTPVPMQRKLSFVENTFTPPPIRTSPQFTSRPSLASLASGASIQPAPPVIYEKIEEEYVPQPRTLRRKGSLESINSVMTETSAQIQRQRMTDAVQRCGSYGDNLQDIVDMLLTLKRKERSLCLFNPDFLKDKINAALEALEICEVDEEEEEEEEQEPSFVVEKPKFRNIQVNSQKSTSPPILKKSVSSRVSHLIEDVIIPPRISKAIPIVAPPTESPKTAEIKALLNSIEGKPIHEKKQLLGDQLFPLVKATGVKHAPKITIRLLDTIELESLAKLMFDKDQLKVQVDKAAATI